MVRVERGTFDAVPGKDGLWRGMASVIARARHEIGGDWLAAWNPALTAWRTSPVWGIGLGSTGAAALRTYPEYAIVTQSQVLKALVELGLPGLLAWGYLWVEIARVGYRTYRSEGSTTRRALLLGILTSLLVVWMEGWIYQNLEVKQVNAVFWALLGVLAFLRGRPRVWRAA